MSDNSLPLNVTLEVEDADEIAAVFMDYETADGTNVIVASAAPPATAELQGNRLESDEEA